MIVRNRSSGAERFRVCEKVCGMSMVSTAIFVHTLIDDSLLAPLFSRPLLPLAQDCLQAFTMTESLEGGDSYKCENCKRCQPHTKRLQIYRCPRVLVITLKRFASKQVSCCCCW